MQVAKKPKPLPPFEVSNVVDLRHFMRVDWYDGLLVNKNHLRHADSRVDQLTAQLFRLWFAGPAVLNVDDPPGVGQLVSIHAAEDTTKQELPKLELARGVCGVTSAGTLFTCEKVHAATPDAPVHQESEPLLVCLEVQESSDPEQARSPLDTMVEIQGPRVAYRAIPRGQFIQQAATVFRDHLPVAQVVRIDGRWDIDLHYIPPTATLRGARSFDSTLLKNLQEGLRRLREKARATALTADIQLGRTMAHEEEKLGEGFMHRRFAAEELHTLLWLNLGAVAQLESQSPKWFLVALALPMAAWWKLNARYFIQNEGPLKDGNIRANRVAEMSTPHLSAGNDTLLTDVAALIEEMIQRLL